MKLIKIEGTKGIAELGNLQREIGLLLLANAKIGDYVIVHAGYAIQILDETEAQKTIALLESYHEESQVTNWNISVEPHAGMICQTLSILL